MAQTDHTMDPDFARRAADAIHWVERERSKGAPRRPLLPTGAPSGMRMGIVVSIGGPLDRFVQVVEPVFNDSEPWDGGFIIPAEEPQNVWLWPPTLADDVEDFVLEGGPPGDVLVVTDDMDILPVYRIKGVWFIVPQPIFGRAPFPEGAMFSDCTETGGLP